MFSFKEFDLKLDTDVIGRNFIYCDEIESTNSYLMDPENNTEPDGTVILAERQIHGKGRKDRKWYSVKDQNLTFSILLKRRLYEKNLNVINLGTAVVVALSLENLFQLKVNLKWPNDILVNGSKIAGILIESSLQGNRIEKLVIGIGLNVNQNSFQGSFAIPPTSIKNESGNDIKREQLLGEILNNFEEMLGKVTRDSNSVLNDWRSRCRMIGEKIFVVDDNYSKAGVFDDIDEQGFIMLRTDDNKIEKIHFGDVSLR
ncbi:MAG: biotin--[acetyl-CoA-carboxylase] ligase [Ignavibacteriales bacterium]|nr:biotin--[acetyl-CoA-carboxylase] ligase [Ignavibacteriales bacterium]